MCKDKEQNNLYSWPVYCYTFQVCSLLFNILVPAQISSEAYYITVLRSCERRKCCEISCLPAEKLHAFYLVQSPAQLKWQFLCVLRCAWFTVGGPRCVFAICVNIHETLFALIAASTTLKHNSYLFCYKIILFFNYADLTFVQVNEGYKTFQEHCA